MSNNNIPGTNEQNRQLFARLWNGLKRKGDGKLNGKNPATNEVMPFSSYQNANAKKMVLSMDLLMTMWLEWILQGLISPLFFSNIHSFVVLNYRKIRNIKIMGPLLLLNTKYLT